MTDLIQYLATLWQQIADNPIPSLIIVGNLVIIESLLSVDNAAVLATMVMDLPKEQRGKALKYGIWGAYFFRGLAMIFAAWLITIWWLKAVGGLYLLFLVYDWWKGKQTPSHDDDLIDKKSNWLYRVTVGKIGNFWATVVLVELMDMAFSIDNVFAAVAFTPNLLLICLGVFIGIFAMRYIAQWFVRLMEKYKFLETAAFIVIGILGVKLVLSIFEHFYPQSQFTKIVTSHQADFAVTLITVCIFFVPILTSTLFNYPKKGE
ncbi:MAG: TerC family protein [Bacteroidetes bacterium]|nr:TerC family protein [Bacteroidota bacterium]